MIKLYVNDVKPENERKFDITKFPDGTSQVWHIKIMEDASKIVRFVVDWKFENEGEFLPVMQLGQLLRQLYFQDVNLHMEFLPYGRQDKPVTNDSTFALQTFLSLVSKAGSFNHVLTVDAHSKRLPAAFGITNIDPSPRIQEVMKLARTSLVCYPDKGATLRGYDLNGASYVCLDKKRNQATGEIEGLEFAHFGGKEIVDNQMILIVDDLCDGGRTFIEAAKLLKGAGAASVSLYTTHGIYSKGTQILFDNGLDRVFNYRNEVSK